MHSSLSWIEWLDRLDRVLQSTFREFSGYARSGSALSLAAIGRSHRQLRALTAELGLLDPAVLGEAATNRLRVALDGLLRPLDALPAEAVPPFLDRERDRERDRLLLSIDGALRDARYAAACLVEPHRRFA